MPKISSVSHIMTIARCWAAASCLVLAGASLAEAAPAEITVWHQEQVESRVKQFQKVIGAFNASPKDDVVKQQVQGGARSTRSHGDLDQCVALVPFSDVADPGRPHPDPA